MSKQQIYDAIIVGSGAAGGIAAHVLVNRGLNVLLLEIGPKWDPRKDYTTVHKWPYEMPFRGMGKPGQYDGLWKINAYTEHLYVNPRIDKYALADGTDFHWTRIHAVGGRTNTWGRVSLRMSEADFKPKTMQDGYGEDWPISYQDLAPYYDRAETLMGVYGSREGLEVLPDGIFMPPPPMRCGEMMLKSGCKKLGIAAIPLRAAVLTRPHEGRAACHYCGECGRGCETSSRFCTLDAIIPKLLTKPNFTLRTHAAAHRVLLDPNKDRVRGIAYIDTKNRREYEAYGKVVVLGAGAMESTRIMLNSKSSRYSTGLANSSGVLGHYLMDNIKSGFVAGFLPQLKGSKISNDDGAGGGHAYIPRHVNLKGGRKAPVLRGWHFQNSSGSPMFPWFARGLPGFGSQLKDRVREHHPSLISLSGFGEPLADFNNYCEIDPAGLKDRFGIPQLRFNAKWGENDLKMADLMYDSGEEILRAAGAEVLPFRKNPPPPPGDATHEVGTARMGADPKTSVLNQFCQAHDIRNLFVVDGSSFVSLAEKNVTLTIIALAWRASDYLAEELKRGNLS